MINSIDSLRQDFAQLREEFDEIKVKRQNVIDAIEELRELELEMRKRIDKAQEHLRDAL